MVGAGLALAALIQLLQQQTIYGPGYQQYASADEQRDASEHHHESDDLRVVEMERTEKGVWVQTGDSTVHGQGENLVLDNKTRTDQQSTEKKRK
jgi:hypothetical protein